MGSMDSEKFLTAVLSVLASLLVCLLAFRGGLVQGVILGHALVGFFGSKLQAFLDFPGYEDMQVWADLFIRSTLYILCFALALSAAPLALAMTASACGALLVMEHGVRVAEAMGKVAGVDTFTGSKHGLLMIFGVFTFGTLWQLWTWAAGSSMAWYFRVLYLPAVLTEGML